MSSAGVAPAAAGHSLSAIERREDPLEGLLEVDVDRKPARRLERHEAVQGDTDRPRRVDRLIPLEPVPAQHAERYLRRLRARGRPFGIAAQLACALRGRITAGWARA